MKIELKRISIAVIGLCISALTFGQLSYGGEPFNWTEKRLDSTIPTITTEALDMDLITAQDAINDREKSIPFRFGIEHEVDYSIENSGRWTTDEKSGMEIWQLAIHCPEAKSINLTFSQYSIPKGGKVFIWSADRQQFLGSFDHQNNEDSGMLATGVIHSDRVVVEYITPSQLKEKTKLSIGQIVHGYRTVLRNEFSEIKEDDRGYFGNSGNCHNNVICPIANDWQIEKRSVVLIILGGSLCSGALVNNTSNQLIPYILTAEHCTPSNNNVSNWVFYFNHESSTCSGNNGPTNNSISGASVKAKNPTSDVTLVRMNNIPPESWNVNYAGWDRSDNANVVNSVGIHHPSGDVKKISFDYDAPQKTTTQSGKYMWEIDAWDNGVTEGGSSGSPLFNPDHRIIGQLYAGTSECQGTQPNNGYDIYGRFGISWDAGTSSSTRLKDWLDPGNTGAVTLNGYPTYYTAVALDAEVSGISGIESVICTNSVSPVVTLKNKGSQTLTSCTIKYQINNGAMQTYNWSGSLAQHQSVNVTLPTITTTVQANTLTVTVSNPNGSTDQNTENNSSTITFTANFDNSNTINLALTFDSYPNESSWKLKNSAGQIIYSGSSYSNTGYANTTLNLNFCLPNGCYTFTISDSYGDGICCGFYGNGSYTLTDDNGGTLATGGNFTYSESTTFCVSNSISNIEKDTGIQIQLFPNPTDYNLTITSDKTIEKITIRDITGKEIQTSKPNSLTHQMSTVTLANGIYLCEIHTQGKMRVEKLEVRH